MKAAWIAIAIISLLSAPIPFIAMLDDDGNTEIPRDSEPPKSELSSPSIYLIPDVMDQLYFQPSIVLRWRGSDGPSGTGIGHYDVQYRSWDMDTYHLKREDPPFFGEWIDLFMNTTMVSQTFPVEGNHAYSFRVRAIDKVGNVEDWPRDDDSRTYVFEIPFSVYDRLANVRERIDEVIERPRNMTPVSRVLPMEPIFVPDCYLDHGDRSVVMYPDETIAPKEYCIGVHVQWLGVDPIGRDDLRYDVQYRKFSMEPVFYIPEDPVKIPFLPYLTEWIDWTMGTDDTCGLFSFDGPGLYMFRCRAFDEHGNVEEYPDGPDAFTYVLPVY